MWLVQYFKRVLIYKICVFSKVLYRVFYSYMYVTIFSAFRGIVEKKKVGLEWGKWVWPLQ